MNLVQPTVFQYQAMYDGSYLINGSQVSVSVGLHKFILHSSIVRGIIIAKNMVLKHHAITSTKNIIRLFNYEDVIEIWYDCS